MSLNFDKRSGKSASVNSMGSRVKQQWKIHTGQCDTPEHIPMQQLKTDQPTPTTNTPVNNSTTNTTERGKEATVTLVRAIEISVDRTVRFNKACETSSSDSEF